MDKMLVRSPATVLVRRYQEPVQQVSHTCHSSSTFVVVSHKNLAYEESLLANEIDLFLGKLEKM